MSLRRSFWRSVETIHHVVYFAPDVKAQYEALGLKGHWMGYFASRAVPLGLPGPEVVTATFHGFAPALVHRAIPATWDLADRDEIMATRLQHGRDVIRPGVEIAGIDIGPAAQALGDALPTLDLTVRPLAAGNVGLPRRPMTSACCGMAPQHCASTAATLTSPSWPRRASVESTRTS